MIKSAEKLKAKLNNGQEQYFKLNKRIMKEVGLEASLLLSVLLYEYENISNSQKLNSKGGFYSTIKNIENISGLSDRKQRTAILKLVEAGFVVKGSECKSNIFKERFFYIKHDFIYRFINDGIADFLNNGSTSSNKDKQKNPNDFIEENINLLDELSGISSKSVEEVVNNEDEVLSLAQQNRNEYLTEEERDSLKTYQQDRLVTKRKHQQKESVDNPSSVVDIDDFEDNLTLVEEQSIPENEPVREELPEVIFQRGSEFHLKEISDEDSKELVEEFLEDLSF